MINSYFGCNLTTYIEWFERTGIVKMDGGRTVKQLVEGKPGEGRKMVDLT